MMEETREARRTSRLHQIMPLYKFIDLKIEQCDGSALCSVPLSAANTNHVGIMHAGVLFSLAEATGGVAISVHRDLGRLAVIAKQVEIRYKRPATTKVRARATLDAGSAAAVRAGIETNPKHAFAMPVELFDDEDRLVAEAVCTFVLRAVA